MDMGMSRYDNWLIFGKGMSYKNDLLTKSNGK